MSVFVAWALAGISAPAVGGEPVGGTVKLWPTAVVVDDAIRLGDIAQLHGFVTEMQASLEELVVTRAPRPGGSRIIPLSTVREAIANFGVNRATVIVKGSAECAVRRPEEPVSPPPAEPVSEFAVESRASPVETLRSAVVSYFDRELSAYGGRADVAFGRTSGQVLDLAGPDYAFRVERKTGSPLGLISIGVTILRGTEEIQRVPLVADVAMLRDTVVARKPINRGAIVQHEDVHLVSRRFTKPGQAGLSAPAQAVGLRARRFLPAGATVTARDLERIPLVKRGQVVEVVSKFGNVTVKTAAKAGEDGHYGELVTVHIPGRRKTRITGRVVGPHRVQVGDWDPPDLPRPVLADGGLR